MAPITHVALHVRSIPDSTAFYEDFCGLTVVHAHGHPPEQTTWLAEPDRPNAFVIVLVPGGGARTQDAGDMTHYGFAVRARDEVDAIADKAREAGCLFWEPMELPFPVGYLCGVTDPDGYVIEFSYGQPLGAGAPLLSELERPQ